MGELIGDERFAGAGAEINPGGGVEDEDDDLLVVLSLCLSHLSHNAPLTRFSVIVRTRSAS